MSFTHAPDVHKTMCHLIQDRVAETPHIPAIAYKKENQWIDVSFQEYANRIKQIGIGLLQLEMLPGARVIVLANTSIDWAICDLGIVTAGGITVPIYPTNTESDALYIGEHSGASIAFVENHLQCKKIYSLIESGQLKKIIQFEGPIDNPDKVISLNEFREIAQRAASATTTDLYQKRMESAKPDDLISITYTSGTTGKPKGVMIHHRMMWQTLSDTYELIHDSVDTSDSLLTFLPLSHVMGKFESMTPWFFGWKCNYAQSVDKLLSNIEEVRPTLMVAVPRIFEKVYAKISDQIENGPELKKTLFKRAVEIGKTYYSYKDKDQFVPPHISIAYQLAYKLVLSKVYEKFGGRMKFFISGGAPLPAELASFLRTAKLIVLEGYGLTETCAPCATNTLHSCIIGTVGKPFPSCELKIASDGEILVKGPTVFKGYYKNEEATREVIQDGWFHTGDLGEIESHGHLRITGRKKDLIITAGGKNISPQNIENTAKTLPFISQFIVHGDQRKYLTALVNVNQEQILSWAKRNGKEEEVKSWDRFATSKEVYDLVQKSIDELNSGLARYETIKDFRIIPHEFSETSGELTPSLKVKRAFCTKKYKELLDGMYPGS